MIGIVGAGITGLTIHHYLHQYGVKSIVFEAADEPGGVMQTVHKDGHVLDCGAQRTRLTVPLQELVEDALDLGDQIVKAADVPLYIYHAGKLRQAPLSIREALTTDLLSWQGKLRILLEPLREPPREDETVEEYLTRAFGHEFATRLGGPLYAGLYASDPAKMPVKYSLEQALDRFGIEQSILLKLLRSRLTGHSPPPIICFREGMQSLPQALYEKYSDTVCLSTPIRRIREIANGYELTTDSTNVRVNEVVLTTPAPTAGSLLSEIDSRSTDALCELRYNPLAVVHLHSDTSLVGAGHQIPFDERCVTLGVTWNDSLFAQKDPAQQVNRGNNSFSTGRAGIYTCYLGGAKTPGAVEWSDERLEEVAAREFEDATGFSADPLCVHRVLPGMPAYDHSWTAFNRINPPEGVYLCGNYKTRAGIPGRIHQGKQLAISIHKSARNDPAQPTD